MYDVYSKHAEDFINHDEILDTLAFADENCRNLELIDSLIEKAALRQGLSHREASVLLACEDEERNEKIFRLAEQIKKDFYGNRIVMLYDALLANLNSADTLQLFSFVPFTELLLPMIITFVAAGMFVGVVGSWTSIRKFMDV